MLPRKRNSNNSLSLKAGKTKAMQVFQARQRSMGAASAVTVLELIYIATVRSLRMSHGNAVIGMAKSIMQSMIFVAIFYAMFELLGLRSSAARGDFIIYMMTGIFLYLTHIKALGAILGAEGGTSPIMQHAPMNPAIALTAAALSSLYVQFLSAVVILTLYYCAIKPFQFYDTVGVLAMFLLAWSSGAAVGMIFRAAKPWFPTAIGILSTIYQRANMIASGKMVLANTLPASKIAFFSWNPLFHTIDQARGFAFVNYNPHNSSVMYPIYLSLALVMIGLLGDFYTRQHQSASWGAKS